MVYVDVDVRIGGGGQLVRCGQKWTRGGVKNRQIVADVLYGRPLITIEKYTHNLFCLSDLRAIRQLISIFAFT